MGRPLRAKTPHTSRLLKSRPVRALIFTARSVAAVFDRKTLKNAFRTVTGNKREYVCFFLALTVIITGFCVSALSLDADLSYAKRQIAETYDYHLAVYTPEEYAPDVNNALLLALQRDDDFIENVRVSAEADGSYIFYIRGTGYSPAAGLPYLIARLASLRMGLPAVAAEDLRTHVTGDVLAHCGGCTIRTSPLYEYRSEYSTPYLASFWGMTLGWLCLSVAALILLYRIRLDHFRFAYGIYLTCGADFSMLYGTAAGEMTACAAIVFLPSVILGAGLSLLLCVLRGAPFAFSVRSVAVLLIAPLLAVLIAVWFPMRRLSKEPPIRLLAARDNAGLVSSPGRSFRLFGQDFPGKYELYAMWRCRRYYARLILSAVLCSALFISGLYVADMQSARAQIPAYEYELRYAPTADADLPTDEDGAVILPRMDEETLDMIRTDAELFLDGVNGIPGVGYVWWQTSRDAGYTSDHLLLSAGQLTPAGASFRVPSDERTSQGYVSAVNTIDYTAVDAAWIDMILTNGLGTFEGDPYAVLEDDRAVILTEDSFNTQVFRFAPGDRVMIAEFTERHGADPVNPEPRAVLMEQIKNCTFTYTEYRVAAVLRGMTSDHNTLFCVNFKEFERLTDQSAARDVLRVYVQNGTDFAASHAAESAIRRCLTEQHLTGWTVVPTGNYFRSTMRAARNESGLSVTLASLLLLLSPLIWLFSQIMFYRGRQGEFDMLYALGAPRGSVASLHRTAGGVLSGLAFLVTLLLSLLCNAAVWFTATVLLPLLHLTEAFAFDYSFSLPALAACLLISAACGFLSCEIPYRVFGRRGYTQRRDH